MSERNNLDQITKAGLSYDDACALRRISMTLHRWHELECGNSDNYTAWCLVRGKKPNKCEFEYDDDGKPFLERHSNMGGKPSYSPIPDRERGALKRLAEIMKRYPTLSSYVQSDPRGCSLYLLRPDDVPQGERADSYYNRGIAVY